ncbi:MAG TPA: 30S ribosomal protein S6 [Anaerolineaceae bacterium]
MRTYEVVLIVHPELDEAGLTGAVEKVKGWITESGGVITKVDQWGRRPLAYPIKKQKAGQYVLITCEMTPSFTNELERNLRLTEAILRFMITVR